MLDKLNNIGDEVYKSWTDEQRREEIGKLVQGYQNGLPVQIMCQMSTAIAGSLALAKLFLSEFLTPKERKSIVEKESGGNEELRSLLKSTLL